jgi:hypothetical protein
MGTVCGVVVAVFLRQSFGLETYGLADMNLDAVKSDSAGR